MKPFAHLSNQEMDTGIDCYRTSKSKVLLAQIKYRILSKYCHWERVSDSIDLDIIEGEKSKLFCFDKK